MTKTEKLHKERHARKDQRIQKLRKENEDLKKQNKSLKRKLDSAIDELEEVRSELYSGISLDKCYFPEDI